MLVCLAVWLANSSTQFSGKVLGIQLPIMGGWVSPLSLSPLRVGAGRGGMGAGRG